jgi:rRNA maturation protein Nop10
MANQRAEWAITLHTECPECGEYFDIIHHQDDF